MEQKPSEITAALDDFLAPWLFPDKGDGSRSAALPGLRRGPAGAARRPVRRLRRLLQLSRMQVHPPLRPGRRGGRRATPGRRCSAQDPETRRGRHPALGPLRPLCPARRGQGGQARLASPRTCRREARSRAGAAACCRCRARSATIRRAASRSPPSIGRYGPYLAHDGKYAKLASTAEVFETGMNAAVAKLADAADGGGRGARLARAAEGARARIRAPRPRSS